MNINDSLCVLIPLKGREKETHRILHYFRCVNLPFKILLADGGDKDLSNSIDTSNLNVDYFYNGPDKNIHDFMHKMRLAFDRINNPLTIMVDNDDFISVSGMIDGIKYLAEHDDFSSYRQNVMSCNNLKPIYKSNSITNGDPFDRIFSAMRNRTVSWHDITRTHCNKILFRILDECSVNDLQMTFSSNMFWSDIYGKSYKGFDKNYYYHVFGNSLVQNRQVFTKYHRWMSDEKFDTSFSMILSASANAICKTYKHELYDVKCKLGEFYLADLAERNNVPFSKLNLMKYIDESKKYDDICNNLVEDTSMNFNICDDNFNCINTEEEFSIIRGII